MIDLTSDARRDLLKEEVPSEGLDGVPCILDKLCAQHDGIPNEVLSYKTLRYTYLKKVACILNFINFMSDISYLP